VVGVPLLNKVLEKAEIPVVAIGGIDEQNMSEVLETGVACVGLIRGIMNAPDIAAAAESLVKRFDR